MELMFQPLRRYADFAGRARRKEYWLFWLFLLVTDAVLQLFAGGFYDPHRLAPTVGSIAVIVFLSATVVPHLAVAVRRLHDTNRSAWWILIALAPLGVIVLLVFFAEDGVPGDNRFGPDPKAGSQAIVSVD